MKIHTHPLFAEQPNDYSSVIVLGSASAPASNQSATPALQKVEEATPPAAAEPAKPAEATPPAAAEPAKPTWSLEDFLASIGPKDLKADDPRLSQWKDVKGMVSAAAEVNMKTSTQVGELNSKLAGLNKELEETRAKIGKSTENGVAPKAADLKEYQELEAKFKTATASLEKFEAKENLATNPAFKSKYDGGMAAFAAEALEVAEAAGIPKETLDPIFNGKNEYEILKALNAAEITDEVAARLIKEKAVAFSHLHKERENILSGKTRSVAEHAAEWEQFNSEYGAATAKRFTAAVQGGLIAAVPKVAVLMAEESPYFKEAGRFIIDELGQRFAAEGANIPYEEVVKALAYARAYPVFEKKSIEQQDKIAELELKIARMAGLGAGAATTTGSDDKASPAPAGGSGLFQQRADTQIRLGGR